MFFSFFGGVVFNLSTLLLSSKNGGPSWTHFVKSWASLVNKKRKKKYVGRGENFTDLRRLTVFSNRTRREVNPLWKNGQKDSKSITTVV